MVDGVSEEKLLPEGDKTPTDWVLPCVSKVEEVKKPLRGILYPAYLKSIQPLLQRRYDPSGDLGVDQWYWGHRGFELELLRAKLNRVHAIRGSSVLVAGCGTGNDIPSYVDYHPSQVVGIDYFNYRRAWESLIREYGNKTQISFVQRELGKLESLADETFDIIGSEGVLQHLKNLPQVLKEFHRILKPNGVIYASFGPLWYCWGGDFVSGYDSIDSGYNHLVLKQAAYQRYLDRVPESFFPMFIYISHNMYNYLRPREYLAAISEGGFEKVHLGAVLQPRAVRCLRGNPQLRANLLVENDELDLTIAGMVAICRKRG